MPPQDPRDVIDRLLETIAPFVAAVERHTNHVHMEGSNPDWVALSEALDEAQEYLRATQPTSTLPPKD